MKNQHGSHIFYGQTRSGNFRRKSPYSNLNYHRTYTVGKFGMLSHEKLWHIHICIARCIRHSRGWNLVSCGISPSTKISSICRNYQVYQEKFWQHKLLLYHVELNMKTYQTFLYWPYSYFKRNMLFFFSNDDIRIFLSNKNMFLGQNSYNIVKLSSRDTLRQLI